MMNPVRAHCFLKNIAAMMVLIKTFHNEINIWLFPFNGCRRFAAYIIYHAVYAFLLH